MSERLLRALALAAALYLLPCLFAHAFWRFALPVLPLLCLATAQGAWLCARSASGWMRTAACLAGLALWPALGLSQNNALFAAAALRSAAQPELDPREAFLTRALDIYPVVSWANRRLPRESRVLLFRDIRGYYLEKPYLWGDPLNQDMIRYRELTGPADLRRRLAALGITHVLVNRGYALYRPSPGYYQPRYVDWMEALLREDGELVSQSADVALYRLSPPCAARLRRAP